MSFTVGERVGILVGLQAVGGPHVGHYGTIVRVVNYWGKDEFIVKSEKDGEELVYAPSLLRKVSPIKELLHPACGRVFANGFQILAVDDSSPRSAKILAIRDGEYVVARIYDPVNDAEWSNGFYTRNAETAHWNFRTR